MNSCPKTRVVLVGWDGADWRLIHPLLDAGLMPNLSRLVERGVMGSIASIVPAVSPLLWTSIVTGMHPDRHGVLGPFEPDPATGGLRAASSRTRRTKALWNILNQSGHRSHVAGWFATHPAEPLRGVHVSNVFHVPAVEKPELWPVVPGSVHPPSLERTLSALRVHPADLTGDDLLPFIPGLSSIDQDRDRRPVALARMLAANITVHGTFTWALENEPWEFAAVYYDLIDQASVEFLQYCQPPPDAVSQQDFDLYHGVVSSAYRFQDLMLGRVLQLAGQDATVIVLSDKGTLAGELLPGRQAEAGAADTWRRTHGILCAAGPGLRHDDLVFGATLLDIAPTVLAMYGLPAGADMPGRVLTEIFLEPPATDRIPSWESVGGDSGRPPAEPAADPETEAVIRKLVELGYADVSAGPQPAAEAARIQQAFNLGTALLCQGRPAEAISHFEQVAADAPDVTVFKLFLAQAYFSAGQLQDCRHTAEALLNGAAGRPWLHLLLANLASVEGRYEDALKLLSAAESGPQTNAAVPELIGRIYGVLGRHADAERLFRSAIAIDADCASAHAGLAAVLLKMHRCREAAESALNAVSLRYDVPRHHLLLGISLAAAGQGERAVQAFGTCLKLNPQDVAAHEWLAILARRAGDAQSAADHQARAEQIRAGAV